MFKRGAFLLATVFNKSDDTVRSLINTRDVKSVHISPKEKDKMCEPLANSFIKVVCTPNSFLKTPVVERKRIVTYISVLRTASSSVDIHTDKGNHRLNKTLLVEIHMQILILTGCASYLK